MKKKSLALIVGLIFYCCFSSLSIAEMAKEGKAEYHAGSSGSFSTLAMEKERIQINYESFGVVIDAPENCPLHKATFRAMGSDHVFRGSSKGSGFLVWTRPNGDKIYATTEKTGKLRDSCNGIATFVGGTGSAKGITGDVEFSTTAGIHPSAEGTFQNILTAKIHWKIP